MALNRESADAWMSATCQFAAASNAPRFSASLGRWSWNTVGACYL
jgi:hypothetical protein